MTKKPFRASRASGVVALILLIAGGAIFAYWRVGVEKAPGDYEVKKGNYRLEDGQFEEAAREFSEALKVNPGHLWAHHGLAVTYLQEGRLEEAAGKFSDAITLDESFAVAYADRGITYDRMGKPEEALKDYRRALELDPEIIEGPGWLWRFMRNISDKPPNIKDRADYLETELAKPPGERLLRLPEKDDAQRMYKK